MVRIKLVPVEPAKEVVIFLSREDALILKKFMGVVSGKSNGPRGVADQIIEGLAAIGIRYDLEDRFKVSGIHV